MTANAREALAREWGATLARLSALDEPDWSQPTRCTGWDVRDLARHTVWGVSMEADAVRRVRMSRGDSAGDSPGGNDGGRASGREVPETAPSAELLASLRRAADDLDAELGAMEPTDSQRPAPLPYGDVTLSDALDIFVMEAGIHGSDVAHALGADRPLEADVVAATVSVLNAFLPVFASAAGSAPADGSSFTLVGQTVQLAGSWSDGAVTMGDAGDRPSVRVSGDDTSVLLFVLGRLPVDDSRLSVQGDSGLARDLKTYVPGP